MRDSKVKKIFTPLGLCVLSLPHSRWGFFMENTGQIIRSKKTGKSRYTPISNDILQSLTLTAEEKSILVHLLSLPEDWMVYKINFGKSLNMGRHRFNNAWKGLVDKGYIVSIRMIDTNTNLMRGWNHMVHEEPVIDENRIDRNTDLPKIGQSEERVIYKVITEQSNNLTKEEVHTVIPKKEKEIKSSARPPRPTQQECQAYFVEKGYSIKDSMEFYYYWESMDWIRKSGPIQKWKAAANQWMQKCSPEIAVSNNKPKIATL